MWSLTTLGWTTIVLGVSVWYFIFHRPRRLEQLKYQRKLALGPRRQILTEKNAKKSAPPQTNSQSTTRAPSPSLGAGQTPVFYRSSQSRLIPNMLSKRSVADAPQTDYAPTHTPFTAPLARAHVGAGALAGNKRLDTPYPRFTPMRPSRVEYVDSMAETRMQQAQSQAIQVDISESHLMDEEGSDSSQAYPTSRKRLYIDGASWHSFYSDMQAGQSFLTKKYQSLKTGDRDVTESRVIKRRKQEGDGRVDVTEEDFNTPSIQKTRSVKRSRKGLSLSQSAQTRRKKLVIKSESRSSSAPQTPKSASKRKTGSNSFKFEDGENIEEVLGEGWITRASRLKKIKTGSDFKEEPVDAEELEKALEDTKRKRNKNDEGLFRKPAPLRNLEQNDTEEVVSHYMRNNNIQEEKTDKVSSTPKSSTVATCRGRVKLTNASSAATPRKDRELLITKTPQKVLRNDMDEREVDLRVIELLKRAGGGTEEAELNSTPSSNKVDADKGSGKKKVSFASITTNDDQGVSPTKFSASVSEVPVSTAPVQAFPTLTVAADQTKKDVPSTLPEPKDVSKTTPLSFSLAPKESEKEPAKGFSFAIPAPLSTEKKSEVSLAPTVTKTDVLSVPATTESSPFKFAVSTTESSGGLFGKKDASLTEKKEEKPSPFKEMAGGFTFGSVNKDDQKKEASPEKKEPPKFGGFAFGSTATTTAASTTPSTSATSLLGSFTAPSTSSFTFGSKPTTEPAKSDQKPLFGATPSAGTTAAVVEAPAKPSVETEVSKPSFPSIPSSQPAPSISFGAAPTTTTPSLSASPFTFGAASKPDTSSSVSASTTETATVPAVVSQASTESKPVIPATSTAFSFGASTTTTTTGTLNTAASAPSPFGGLVTQPTSTPSFGFGSTPAATAPATVPTATTSATTGFSFSAGQAGSNPFGGSTTAAPSSTAPAPFTFGGAPSTSTPTTSAPQTTQSFVFGQQPSSTAAPPSSGFSFSQGQSTNTPSFGTAPTATPMFGATAPTPSTFGSTPSSSSAFGSVTPTTPSFGAAPATNAFGSSSTPAFGASSSTPAFGAASSTPAPFGSSASGFGASSAPGFGAATGSSTFGSSAPSGFGSNASTGAFNSGASMQFGQTPQPAFGQQNQPFGGANPSPFGQAQSSAPAPAFGQQPTNAFAGSSAPSPFTQGSTGQPSFNFNAAAASSTPQPNFNFSAGASAPAAGSTGSSFSFGAGGNASAGTFSFNGGGNVPNFNAGPASKSNLEGRKIIQAKGKLRRGPSLRR